MSAANLCSVTVPAHGAKNVLLKALVILTASALVCLSSITYSSLGVAKQVSCPVFLYSMGIETCFDPSDKAEAGAQMHVPPVDPSSAVTRATGLHLSKVLVLNPAPNQATLTAHQPSQAINYLFGPIPPPPGYGCPMPSLPRFMIVSETVGHTSNNGISIDRPSYSTYDPSTGQRTVGYCPWELHANLPGRPLVLTIRSNLQRQLILEVGERVLMEARRHPLPKAVKATATNIAIPSATPAQAVKKTHAYSTSAAHSNPITSSNFHGYRVSQRGRHNLALA